MIQIYTLITPLPKYCGASCLQLLKHFDLLKYKRKTLIYYERFPFFLNLYLSLPD